MGSLPRLKKKTELRYRKGHQCDALNCKCCTHFVGTLDRCEVMGLQESRRYRVRADFTCDAQIYEEQSQTT